VRIQRKFYDLTVSANAIFLHFPPSQSERIVEEKSSKTPVYRAFHMEIIQVSSCCILQGLPILPAEPGSERSMRAGRETVPPSSQKGINPGSRAQKSLYGSAL
jgi:hypothetical protein